MKKVFCNKKNKRQQVEEQTLMPKKKKEEQAPVVSPESLPTYVLYRNSTIGKCLQESLAEFGDRISEELKEDILNQFDKSIIEALATKVNTKASFKGTCNTYQFVDDVYMFELREADFKIETENVHSGPLKIMACNANINTQKTKKGKKK